MSAREKDELVKFVAATGENYDRYLDWCDKRDIKPFTKGYLHTWIQRRRHKVQVAREEHKEEVRRVNTFSKERRLDELERDIDIINTQLVLAGVDPHSCTECGKPHVNVELLIKLTEQKRKLLEAIAKERNELGKPLDESDGDGSARDRLRLLSRAALASPKETKIIEGTVVVVSD